jgi:serine/threonine protein kinase
MRLTSGSRIGPYEIVAPLGAGGMGEVYRAHDARLGREVAIKVLPASFAVDADHLRRFEQEARAIGALNHPNILGVYDAGSHEGAPRDTVGVDAVWDTRLTSDGKSYAYVFIRSLSRLYQVTGRS